MAASHSRVYIQDESRLIGTADSDQEHARCCCRDALLLANILFVRRRGVVTRSIDSIAATAAILARSPELDARLRGTAHKTLDELRDLLALHKYMMTTGYESGARSLSIQMLSRTGTEMNKL